MNKRDFRKNQYGVIVESEVQESVTELKEGYLIDYISGLPVRANPEEVDAVQVFSRMLIDDYNYPRELIQTRPQWRVKVRPSDTNKEYPIDIAVFSQKDHNDDSIEIFVECKKSNRKDGKTQLESWCEKQY